MKRIFKKIAVAVLIMMAAVGLDVPISVHAECVEGGGQWHSTRESEGYTCVGSQEMTKEEAAAKATEGKGEVPEGCVSSSVFSNKEINGKKYYCDETEEGDGVFYILGIVINILTFGIGTAAVVGIALSAVQYLTAGDNVGQIQKAKLRITHIVIGLAAYAVFWGVLQFLLPGGLFGNGK